MTRSTSMDAGFRRTAIAILILAFVSPGCFARRGTSIEQLLRQPITAEHHEAIAARYRNQAAEARALAATHVTMATRYRAWEGGPPLGPYGQRMEDHCRALAAGYEDAAARYEALAASHAALARDWKGTPGRERQDGRKY